MKTLDAMTDAQRKMIEEFQCPGCVSGSDTATCKSFKFKNDVYGFQCIAQCPGTRAMPGGLLALGLPRGFNKVGQAEATRTKDVYIRLWTKEDAPPKWDKLNVAVWAMEEDGYLFVRTFSPRINKSYVDVIQGGTLKSVPGAINVGEFKDDID